MQSFLWAAQTLPWPKTVGEKMSMMWLSQISATSPWWHWSLLLLYLHTLNQASAATSCASNSQSVASRLLQVTSILHQVTSLLNHKTCSSLLNSSQRFWACWSCRSTNQSVFCHFPPLRIRPEYTCVHLAWSLGLCLNMHILQLLILSFKWVLNSCVLLNFKCMCPLNRCTVNV